jgi:hypothetical protein
VSQSSDQGSGLEQASIRSITLSADAFENAQLLDDKLPVVKVNMSDPSHVSISPLAANGSVRDVQDRATAAKKIHSLDEATARRLSCDLLQDARRLCLSTGSRRWPVGWTPLRVPVAGPGRLREQV